MTKVSADDDHFDTKNATESSNTVSDFCSFRQYQLKMQKICVKAPDIIMSGDISIKTAMSVFIVFIRQSSESETKKKQT